MSDIVKYNRKEVILIISGYSTGSQIAPLFYGLGYNCIHIGTKQEFAKESILTKDFRDYFYMKNIIVDSEDNIQALLKELKSYNIIAIIPGSEYGVKLADRLSSHFRVNSANNLDKSESKRNKFMMQDTIGSFKLNKIESFVAKNIERIHEWIKLNQFPRYVVKPIASTLTDSVFYCNTIESINDAFHYIISKKDSFNSDNNEVLIQKYIEGTQFIVNTISSDGVHYVTDIWREVRISDEAPSNDIYSDLVMKDANDFKILSTFAEAVLNSMSIKFGPAHLEIRINDDGIFLIEIGARLSGSIDTSIPQKIFGNSQMSLLPYAYLEPKMFSKLIEDQSEKKIYARYVYMSSKYQGEIVKTPSLDYFKNLETFYSGRLHIKNGGSLQVTNRSLGIGRPGHLYLISEDPTKIVSDYKELLRLEDCFYRDIIAN